MKIKLKNLDVVLDNERDIAIRLNQQLDDDVLLCYIPRYYFGDVFETKYVEKTTANFM